MKTFAMKKSRLVLIIAALAPLIYFTTWGRSWLPGATGPENEPATGTQAVPAEKKPLPVVAVPVEERLFRETVAIQGVIKAKNYAMVSPRVAGTIDTLSVQEGDPVTAGQTELFQIDPVRLEKTVQIKEHELAVARCTLLERQANLEKGQADLDKARLDFQRYQELFNKQVVSSNDYELQELHYKQMQATYKHDSTSVDLAAEQVRQAETALEIAHKDLIDTRIVAPLTGYVTQRLQEPGERGEPGRAVLQIEDLSVVEVSAYLPALLYARIVPGQTRLAIEVAGTAIGDLTVESKSPTIHPALRTFEIKALIQSPPESVRPGGLAHIEVLLDEQRAAGVPSVAVCPRRDGTVVFVVAEGRARQVPVTPGLTDRGWTAIGADTLAPGAQVVIMGQDRLNDNDAVSIQQEN